MPLDLAAKPDADYERLKNWIVKGTVVQLQGQLYKVTKVNPKNYQATREDGARFNLRREGRVTRAPRQDAWAGPEEVNAFTSEFKLGSTVRFASLTHKRKYGDHVMVISNISQDNTFKLVRLGGTDNTYLRGFRVGDLKLAPGNFIEE